MRIERGMLSLMPPNGIFGGEKLRLYFPPDVSSGYVILRRFWARPAILFIRRCKTK
jgi:hypothetical protein